MTWSWPAFWITSAVGLLVLFTFRRFARLLAVLAALAFLWLMSEPLWRPLLIEHVEHWHQADDALTYLSIGFVVATAMAWLIDYRWRRNNRKKQPI